MKQMKPMKHSYGRDLLLVLTGLLLTLPGYAKDKASQGTQGYRDEINRPAKPWKGPPRNGAQVYAYRCASCHERTTQGAPMPNDKVEWQMRARQGMDVLMAHTINGYNQELMPPRGGCENCSDAELRAGVLYILEKSGITPNATGKL